MLIRRPLTRTSGLWSGRPPNLTTPGRQPGRDQHGRRTALVGLRVCCVCARACGRARAPARRRCRRGWRLWAGGSLGSSSAPSGAASAPRSALEATRLTALVWLPSVVRPGVFVRRRPHRRPPRCKGLPAAGAGNRARNTVRAVCAVCVCVCAGRGGGWNNTRRATCAPPPLRVGDGCV